MASMARGLLETIEQEDTLLATMHIRCSQEELPPSAVMVAASPRIVVTMLKIPESHLKMEPEIGSF